MMKRNLLLTLTLSLATLPAHADVLAPTIPGVKGAEDLAPPRVRAPKPEPMPAEAAPAVVTPPARAAEQAPAPPAPAAAAPQVKAAEEVPRPAAASLQPAAKPAAAAPAPRAAESGWFAGVGLGNSHNLDYNCIGCGAAAGSVDDSGFAYKLFGGYRFNTYLAVLGGYASLADTKAAGAGNAWTNKLEVDGFYGAVQGILPVTRAIDVFATAGLFRWDQDASFNASSASHDGTDLMVGLGASYALANTGAKVQLEWNRLNDVGSNAAGGLGHKDDYDLFTLNLVYQF